MSPHHHVHEGVRRFSVGHCLIALVACLIVLPLVEELPSGLLIEKGLLTVVELSAVLAVGGRRRTLTAAVVLVTPALVGTWTDHLRPGLIPPGATLLASML